MRIAIGQLWQETNTLNPLATTRADFEQFGICRGDELVERMANVNELGGFIQSMRSWAERPEIAGLVRLPAWPSGTATWECFEWLRSEFFEAVDAAGSVDAYLLALHGAMVAERCPDVEGAILEELRKRVGPDVPIVATLDLHANITREMVNAADVLVMYHSMPHIDIFETGQRGAEALRRILVEGDKPSTAYCKIPAVVPAENSNTEADAGIAVDLKRRVVELEAQSIVLSAGIAPVQPWMDIPQFGSSVVVTTNNDSRLAQATCTAIAEEFWQRRQEYMPTLVSVEDAVRFAQEENGLVVLSDAADATTSGAPGDSVWILAELLKYRWPRAALVTVVAPEVVSQCESVAVGTSTNIRLGGVRDSRFGTTIELKASIERRFDARFIMTGHIGKNMPIDMGRSVVLRHDNNVFVIVTTRSGPHFAPELFRTAGLEPFDASVVIAKSPCGFRAVYERHASAIYSVKAPGCAPSDFWNYDFTKIPRPLWPWDEIERWTPTESLMQK
ncbi:MAG: M81 family metallopeptidase [Planctomycetaceae bacterium]|nr:M81 family metallopeptidase [Planctomycetales bacterium]MCB9924307.1 M81 family metallopeptidase [Planctomycetaceae bacterium]